MRDVLILKFCDICLVRDGERVEATSQAYAIGIGDSPDGRPVMRGVEACDVHQEEIEAWRELLSQLSTYDELVGAKGKKGVTPTRVTTPARKAASHHDVAAIAGPQHPPRSAIPGTGPFECPKCGDPKATRSLLSAHIWREHRPGEVRPTAPQTHCPDCGQKFDTPQGIGSHRSVAHGYDPVQEALDGIVDRPKQLQLNGASVE